MFAPVALRRRCGFLQRKACCDLRACLEKVDPGVPNLLVWTITLRDSNHAAGANTLPDADFDNGSRCQLPNYPKHLPLVSRL